MKRKDLTVGAELYYGHGSNWVRSEHGGQKAIVVAVEPYEYGHGRHQQVPNGHGVLVDLFHPDLPDDTPTRTIVTLGQLRGPYTETREQVRQAAKADREQRDAEYRQWKAQKQATTEQVERARALGVDATSEYGRRVSLAAADLARLLDAFEAQQRSGS